MAAKKQADNPATPAMQVEFRDIASLKPHPRNAEWRTHPQEQVNELAELLTEFGWLRNVILSSDGYIVAGHGILTAARQRGELTAPTVTMPHKHDSPECLKFLVAENTVQTRAVTEPEGLAALLADIQQQSVTGLAGTGYDAGQLDALIGQLAASDFEKDLPDAFKEVDPTDDAFAHRCPRCNFEWNDTDDQ